MPKCELCGEPMPPGEEMFKFHGYSGPCPKPGTPMTEPTPDTRATVELLRICELTREQIAPLEPDTGFIDRIIRDLRRLVDIDSRDNGGTHAADGSCWDWGRQHYECALRRIGELRMEADASAAHIAALEKEVEQLRGEPGVSEERLAELETDRDAAQRRLGVLEAACEATVVAFDRADKEARCYADNWADLRAAAEVARAALAHREGR